MHSWLFSLQYLLCTLYRAFEMRTDLLVSPEFQQFIKHLHFYNCWVLLWVLLQSTPVQHSQCRIGRIGSTILSHTTFNHALVRERERREERKDGRDRKTNFFFCDIRQPILVSFHMLFIKLLYIEIDASLVPISNNVSENGVKRLVSFFFFWKGIFSTKMFLVITLFHQKRQTFPFHLLLQ